MKQFSTIIQGILLLAVGVLFYLHFKGNKQLMALLPEKNAASAVKAATTGSVFPLLAYVELDSINEKVGYISKRKKALEAEQKQILEDYDAACQKQETARINFIQKGNPSSQKDVEEFQQNWMAKQQEVENHKQLRAQQLAKKSATMMQEMQNNLKVFLNDYNKERRYTYIFATGGGYDYIFYKDSCQNITPEIIEGLNKKFNAQ
jgi:outer membrane protein